MVIMTFSCFIESIAPTLLATPYCVGVEMIDVG